MSLLVEGMEIRKSGILSRSSFPNWVVGTDYPEHDLSSKVVSVASSQYAALLRTETLLNSSCDLARSRYIQAATASPRAPAASARVAAANGKSVAHTLPVLA